MTTDAPFSPSSAHENSHLWRDLIRLSELFRAVVALDAPKNQSTFNHITVNQARIFCYLFHCRAQNLPVHVKSIARDLNVSPAAASQAVDRLVSYGLLDRTPDPHDRRAVRLDLSQKGETLIRRHELRASALLSDLLADVSPADFDAFTRILDSLFRALQSRWQAFIDSKTGSAAPDASETPSAPPFTAPKNL